jgi:hypothetical protein
MRRLFDQPPSTASTTSRTDPVAVSISCSAAAQSSASMWRLDRTSAACPRSALDSSGAIALHASTAIPSARNTHSGTRDSVSLLALVPSGASPPSRLREEGDRSGMDVRGKERESARAPKGTSGEERGSEPKEQHRSLQRRHRHPFSPAPTNLALPSHRSLFAGASHVRHEHLDQSWASVYIAIESSKD